MTTTSPLLPPRLSQDEFCEQVLLLLLLLLSLRVCEARRLELAVRPLLLPWRRRCPVPTTRALYVDEVRLLLLVSVVRTVAKVR